MTVNEQLRRTAQRVKGDLTDVPTPIPPSKPARRVPLALGAGLIALLAVVTVVWLGSFAPESTKVNPASGDAAMVRDWVEGALAGRFDEISSLTYGEFGEPEAMAQLAQTLHGYRAQYGEPEMTIEPFETNGGDLAFTCIALDFGDFDVSGGIVVREWPDLGRRLWEFRNGMTGCVGESSVTTTLPALSVLSETWHYPSDAIGLYSMAAMGDFRVTVVALKRSSLDLMRRRVTVSESATEINGSLVFGTPKTHKSRVVVFPRFLADRLASHCGGIGPDDPVFTAPMGGYLRSANYRKNVWKPALRAAGIDESLRIHDLRATAASLMIAGGASIKAVQRA